MPAPSKPLLNVLNGGISDIIPIWLMRQAGRYLPEYRELRAKKGGFLALVNDSDAAAEITLQPVRRFGFDGAILFSDILIVPHALGQDLRFEEGEGPRLSPPLVDAALARWSARRPGWSRSIGLWSKVKSRPCPPKRLCWALPAARGRSRPIWWRARAAATRPRRGASLMPIRRPFPRSSTRSRR